MKKIILLLLVISTAASASGQRFGKKHRDTMSELTKRIEVLQAKVATQDSVIALWDSKLKATNGINQDLLDINKQAMDRNILLTDHMDSLYTQIAMNKEKTNKFLQYLYTPMYTKEMICYTFKEVGVDSVPRPAICDATKEFYEENKNDKRYMFTILTVPVFPDWKDVVAWVRKQQWNW